MITDFMDESVKTILKQIEDELKAKYEVNNDATTNRIAWGVRKVSDSPERGGGINTYTIEYDYITNKGDIDILEFRSSVCNAFRKYNANYSVMGFDSFDAFLDSNTFRRAVLGINIRMGYKY